MSSHGTAADPIIAAVVVKVIVVAAVDADRVDISHSQRPVPSSASTQSPCPSPRLLPDCTAAKPPIVAVRVAAVREGEWQEARRPQNHHVQFYRADRPDTDPALSPPDPTLSSRLWRGSHCAPSLARLL